MATIVTNAITALNPEIWKRDVQDYLNAMLILEKVANKKCEEYLSAGDQVNFPYVSDVRLQDYTPGTELTIDAIAATQDSLTVDQSKAATFYIDPQQERQALANYAAQLKFQAAYQLANNIDQQGLDAGVSAATTTLAGGTLSANTVLPLFDSAYSQLFRNNAVDGELFAVVDSNTNTLLTQAGVANGFNTADAMLRNQWTGKASNFNVFVSNNLKSSVTLSMATQPTAANTVTVYGVTWTWVADNTAANPGEIAIGADAAEAQNNLEFAINGTGTPGTGTYIDISTANRRMYQNRQVAIANFAADDAAITAYGRIGATETFTAAGNVFGTETSNMIFGRMGAISLGIQMYPELYVRDEPRMIGKNYITTTLFGTKVFTRDAQRLVKASFNVQQ
ncbi:hypothetical protein KBA63_00080 [Candidatus Woesebacteria bacterium]|nr:hypothetical protein [Candidatus Woesebacteria bacterium]